MALDLPFNKIMASVAGAYRKSSDILWSRFLLPVFGMCTMLCSVPRLEQLAALRVPVPVNATIWEMVDNDVVDGTPRLIG